MTRTVLQLPLRRKRNGGAHTALAGMRRTMSMHDRLKRARAQAGFESAAAAAKAFDWNLNTYRSNENGNAPFGRDKAIRYANAFHVRVDWLLQGRGPMKSGARQRVMVMGYVGAGAVVHELMGDDPIDYVDAPFPVPDDCEAFIVRGDSMEPAYMDGTYIIVRRVDDADSALFRRVIVTLEDDRRYVKQLVRGSKPGVYTLISHNAAPIPDVRIKALARVVGTVEP